MTTVLGVASAVSAERGATERTDLLAVLTPARMGLEKVAEEVAARAVAAVAKAAVEVAGALPEGVTGEEIPLPGW